jgi:hypothetical protein
MGFNKKYLRSLESVKEELEKTPDSINYYMRADAFIGPKESVDYIYEFWESYKKNKDLLKNASPME